MADLASLLAVLDAGERVRGRGFERLCRWVLENAPEYAAKVEKVWLWDEWPGRWKVEAGIDLVAEDRDGGLWAVQAKHYDPANAIKKSDLDSFLSESSRAQFVYRLLIATTDHLGPTARRTLDGQEKPVGTLLRSDLVALDLPWPRSLAALRPARPKPKRPRPHQRHAVKAVVDGFGKRDRGQLVMACGTGKTLAARFLHDALGSRRTLVLVPSLSLVQQTLREWLSVAPLDYLAVCSDETVAAAEHDAVIASTSELGVPVTTDPDEIASFLRRRRPGVVFATYQSSPRIADAQRGRVPAFDLALCDEAHRCTGPLAGVFTTILDPTRIKARRRLFMTATPRYYTGRLRKEASEADWEIASMDDEQKFGPVLHRLTFAQAVDQDLLCDYQVVVVGVSDSSYRAMAERAAFVTADGETITDARTLASQLGLLRAMRNHDLRRVVSFHSRIRSARDFAGSLPEVLRWMPRRRRPDGALWTHHVSGEMSSGEREARLNQLREVGPDERGVLTNARCLTEGVDVPTLDGVAFIEPRRSQVDIVQAVGRAMRRADDKTVGTIVIPVFVDENADPEQALDSSEFDRVWQVVKALRAHDEVLADELDELRRERGRRKTSRGRPGKVKWDVPTGIGTAFAHAFDAKVVETSTANWESWFGLLQRFAAREGHARVPYDHDEDGMSLGNWGGRQRETFRQGALDPRRARLLESVPGWTWTPFDDDWEHGLAAASSYFLIHGELRGARNFISPDGFRLGNWLHGRRSDRRKGTLSSKRIAALDALGMVWHTHDHAWGVALAAVRRYREEYGHLRVPTLYVDDTGFGTGAWLHNQRQARRNGTLPDWKVMELDELGMVWNPHDEDWARGADASRQFFARHGNLRVPNGYVSEDGFPLNAWLAGVRSRHASGKLSAERVASLDALGMVWDPHRTAWDTGIAATRAYREANGNVQVPSDFKTDSGFRLGQWINVCRVQRRKGELSAKRIAELDKLGMVWEPLESNWERGFVAAREFREQSGHLRVPAKFVTDDGFKLGMWLGTRRQLRKKGKLSPERIAELDALGMVWNARKTT